MELLVIVTHDRTMAYAVDRFIEIRDGKTSVKRCGDGRLPKGAHSRRWRIPR